MLLTAMITALVSILGTYIPTYISADMGQGIRGALFRKVQDFSANDSRRFSVASLVTRSTNDVAQVQQAFSAVVKMLLPAPFMTVAELVLVFSKNRLLALVIMGFTFLVIPLTLALGKKLVPIYEKLQSVLDNVNRTVGQSIIGVRVIWVFDRSRYEKMKTDETFREYVNTAIKANKLYAVMISLIMISMNSCTLIIVWIGGQQAAAGQTRIGGITAMIEYAILILMYLLMGVYVFLCIPQAQTCAHRVNRVLNTSSEFAGQVIPFHVPSTGAKAEFQNVIFHYAGTREPVLHDIFFTVRKGQMTAIIGSMGSRKSTITNSLLRFYNVQQGHILIGGKGVWEYPQKESRDKIDYIPQETFLFSGTIIDNPRRGRKDATDEEIYRAAGIVRIDDFIMQTEKGLFIPAPQGGSNFSGGQKQRLSIVRAIIKKPDIYMLDDSFPALDFKTDAKPYQAPKQEVMDSTAIIVARRTSTIVDADRTIVLDEDRIVGEGAHQELLHNCLIYQQIIQSQLSREELT